VSGALLPTADPFLYTLSMTAADGVTLDRLEQAVAAELDRTAREGVTPQELEKARGQLRARLVFENDSVTNVAHQLGFFQTIASADLFPAITDRIGRVTLEDLGRVAARLGPSHRTVGWFKPILP
jgi:zinc protease